MSAIDAMRAGLRRAMEATKTEEEAERARVDREGEPAPSSQLSFLSSPSSPAETAAPAVPVDPHAPVVVIGEVTYVVFSSVDTGFRVLKIRRDDLPDDSKESLNAVVAGRSSTIRIGDRVRAVGRWEKGKHGLQLRSESISPVDAVSDEGLARSLDGLVAGLGSGRAHRLVDEMGGAEKTVAHLDRYVAGSTVLEHVATPGTLLGSMTWMPYQVRLDLLVAWRGSRLEREVEARLASLDLPPALRAKLIAKYGSDAARVVLEDPYRLPMEVEGVGFLTADEVAGKVGVGRDSDERMDAAVMHVIREEADDGGHTVCGVSNVSKAMFDLFMKRPPPAPFADDPKGTVAQALDRLVEKKLITFYDPGGASIGESARYSLPYLHKAEVAIARGLAGLIAVDRPLLAYAEVLEEIESRGSTDKRDRLTEEQMIAVRSVFDKGVVVVTGPPGVGKTHACRRIVEVAQTLGLHVDLCAPTARAAKRLKESTDVEAVTIHRLLAAQGEGRFQFNADAPLDSDFVLIDESSMISCDLMAALISALRPSCRLVLVGDFDQLPPVGPGAPFRDVINSGVVPVARLTKIQRQVAGSAIVRASHGILRGVAPCPSLDGDRSDGCLHMVHKPTQEATASAVVQIVMSLKEELGVDPWEALVIAPMRKGECGVTALNTRLQSAMNPPGEDRPEILYGKEGKDGKEDNRRVYRLGDRVRQTKNDYDRNVVNGDVGRIVEVFHEKKRGKGGAWLEVDFGEGVGLVKYDGAQLSSLVLSYCNTVHACVDPETIVETDLGLVSIAEVVESGARRIASFDGPKAFCSFVSNPTRDMIEIETKGGYQLKVTPDHGIDVWDERAGDYVRKAADEISVDDWLRLRLGSVIDDQPLVRLPDPPSTSDMDCRAVRHRFPRELTEDVAEFFGLFVGDGTLFRRGFRLMKRHREVTETFATHVRDIFGARAEVTVSTSKHYENDVFECTPSSVEISLWLKEIGGLSPKKKAVPRCVMRSSPRVQARFLRGLFEDGTVAINKRRKKSEEEDAVVDHIEYTTIHERIARDVQTMLLRLGIASRLSRWARKSDGVAFFAVYIYSEFVSVFREKIGFISPFKRDRLDLEIGDCRVMLPLSKDELGGLVTEGVVVKDSFFYKNAIYRGTVSRSTLKAELARTTERGEGRITSRMRDRVENFHHVRVRSLRWYEGPSMCVEVPDGHRFLQNGFTGWNCQGGQGPAVVLALVDQHYVMLSRTLLYTAITRAQHACIVVGSRRAVETAARNARDDARRTALPRLLADPTSHAWSSPNASPSLPSSQSRSTTDADRGADRERSGRGSSPRLF